MTDYKETYLYEMALQFTLDEGGECHGSWYSKMRLKRFLHGCFTCGVFK